MKKGRVSYLLYLCFVGSACFYLLPADAPARGIGCELVEKLILKPRVGLVPGLYDSVPISAGKGPVTLAAGPITFTTYDSIFPIPNGRDLITKVEYSNGDVHIRGDINCKIIRRNRQTVLIYSSLDLNQTVERPAGAGAQPSHVRIVDGKESWSIPSKGNVPGMKSLTPEGNPVQMIALLMQLRLAGVPFGGLGSAEIHDVIDARTSLELAALVRGWHQDHPSEDLNNAVLNELIMKTHTVRYVQTVLEQTGHRIVSAEVIPETYSTLDQLKFSGRDGFDPQVLQLLRDSELAPNEPVLSKMDIRLKLAPQAS